MRTAAAALVVVVVTGLAACGGGSGDADRPQLVVSAAASLAEPLRRCANRVRGADVRLSLGGSDELAAQIRQGAAPDVFVPADTELAGALAAEGLLERPSVIATNELVLAVPRGSELRSIDDLAAPGVKVAIGSPSVPVGRYARDALSKVPGGAGDAILANVRTSEPDVRGVVGKLAHGAADAGFVYRSDVAAAGGEIEGIRLPDRLAPAVAYGAGVVRGTDQPRLARRFLADLTGGRCAHALREAGFGSPAR